MCISRTGKAGRVCPDCSVVLPSSAGNIHHKNLVSTTTTTTRCPNPNLGRHQMALPLPLLQGRCNPTNNNNNSNSNISYYQKKASSQDIEWSPRSSCIVVDDENALKQELTRRTAAMMGLSLSPPNKSSTKDGTTAASKYRPPAELKDDNDYDYSRDETDNNNNKETFFVRLQLQLQYNDATLTTLHLDNCHIGDAGAALLGDALLFNGMVTELRLVKNDITAKGVSDLCSCLEWNQDCAIEKLNVSSNPLGDDGIVAIATLLEQQPSKGGGRIKSLWLMATNMGDVGAAALAKALVHHPIQELYLQDNHLGPRSAIAMAHWLSTDVVLQVLNLHKNTLGDDGVVTLIRDGLIQNDESHLEQLVVSENDLCNDAAVAVGAYLGWNPMLRMLDLSMNMIGDAGLKVLAMGMTQNFRLAYLNVGENLLSDSGIYALAKCLECCNSKLNSLSLHGNVDITEVGVQALARALVTNRSLMVVAGLGEAGAHADLLQALHLMLERNRM